MKNYREIFVLPEESKPTKHSFWRENRIICRHYFTRMLHSGLPQACHKRTM